MAINAPAAQVISICTAVAGVLQPLVPTSACSQLPGGPIAPSCAVGVLVAAQA